MRRRSKLENHVDERELLTEMDLLDFVFFYMLQRLDQVINKQGCHIIKLVNQILFALYQYLCTPNDIYSVSILF